MEETPCIRIGHLKIVDHLILGLAGLGLETGELNLSCSRLSPLVMTSWEQIREALVCKNIEAAFLTVPMAMDLFASGLDIRLLMFTNRSGSLIVKKTGAKIKTIADFKGKTVLVPSDLSIQAMLLHRLLSTASLKLGPHDDNTADVAYEVVPAFLMSEMLKNDTDNDIAGFIAEEPHGSQAVLNGTAKKICSSQDLWNNHPCCCFVIHAPVLDKHPEAITEIIDLFLQIAAALEHPENDHTVLDAQKFLCCEKPLIQDVLMKKAVRFDPSLLVPDIRALDTIADYMKKSMDRTKHDIDIKRFVDNTIILNSDKLITTADN